jgi:hypothetical protein
MPEDRVFQQWIEARKTVGVPQGFADRVMAAIDQQERQSREASVGLWMAVMLQSRTVRLLLCSAAAAVAVVRLGCLFAPLLVF